MSDLRAALAKLVTEIDRWVDDKDLQDFHSLQGWIKEELREAREALTENPPEEP